MQASKQTSMRRGRWVSRQGSESHVWMTVREWCTFRRDTCGCMGGFPYLDQRDRFERDAERNVAADSKSCASPECGRGTLAKDHAAMVRAAGYTRMNFSDDNRANDAQARTEFAVVFAPRITLGYQARFRGLCA